jgi:organic radical activating enzyme
MMFFNQKHTVTFHLTDQCNIRCKDCHWFSQPINSSDRIIDYMNYLNWININIKKIKFIKLSGGEPTLYPDFLNLINNIPVKIRVRVNSNGTNIDALKQINRRNVELAISKNRKVNPDFEDNIKKLNFPYSIVSFNGSDACLKDEVKFGEDEKNFCLIDKPCFCSAKEIRFGSDGYAYNCETGLRSKNKLYQTGLSLWGGILCKYKLKCTIKKECLSNFLNENKYKLIK